MNSSAKAALAAATTSSSVAPGRPLRMFSIALAENTVESCGTMPMRSRSADSAVSRTSTPSSVTAPAPTS